MTHNSTACRAAAAAVALSVAFPAATQAQMQPGDLLVNSINQSALRHLKPDGTVVQSTGETTGDLWEGAAILPGGRWVTTHRLPSAGVNIFDPITGVEVAHFDTPGILMPGDVSAFSDSTFIIADQFGDSLWHYAGNGALLDTFDLPAGCHPFGVCVDKSDEIWVACLEGQKILHLDRNGVLLDSFDTGHNVGDIVPAPDGTLWATDYDAGTVMHYGADGGLLFVFAATSFPAAALAVTSDGTLWVTSGSDDLIHHFAPDGTLIGSIPAPHGPVFMTTVPAEAEPIGENYCGPANANSSGSPAVMSGMGSNLAAANDVTLTAQSLPTHQVGMLLSSQVQGFSESHAGSQGNLCLSGGIGRYSSSLGSSGANGVMVFSLDLTQTPTPTGPTAIVAGETWYWQTWYRDVNPTTTSNFTDGLSITFE